MPSIEEAWNLPISAEMSSRQQQQQQQPGGPSYKYGATPTGPPPPYPQAQGQNAKRFKVRECIKIEDKYILETFFNSFYYSILFYNLMSPKCFINIVGSDKLQRI